LESDIGNRLSGVGHRTSAISQSWSPPAAKLVGVSPRIKRG